MPHARPIRRYRRSPWGRLLAAALFAAAILLRWWIGTPDAPTSSGSQAPHSELTPGIYAVERAIDGDTLVLADRHIHVRLQGIDAPEIAHEDKPSQPWANQATAFTQQFIRDAGGRVRIELDGETLDHYGRSLAFVWDHQHMLNEELVRAGLARAMLDNDYSQAKKDRLRMPSTTPNAQRADDGPSSDCACAMPMSAWACPASLHAHADVSMPTNAVHDFSELIFRGS